MPLVRQLLLAQRIQTLELGRNRLKTTITHTRKLHLHNDPLIGHHHSNIPEQHLQVLWKLLSTCITWVHSDEVTDLWLETNIVGFTWELELSELGSLGLGDFEHLHGHNGEDVEMDSVELIEATPKT